MLGDSNFVQKFNFTKPHYRVFAVVLILSLLAGTGTGFVLASKGASSNKISGNLIKETPKSAQQDNRTFRDFAEGTINKKAEPKTGETYGEGTHMLVRIGAVPVALTSSVIDLSQYEGKKVKVYGETQKAIKEGWLMDVGKVEEIK